MSHSKLVSVIIPCYNYGNLLPKAVNSVLKQTYKEVEIIVINDGSTDNTEEVARKYISKYKNISYHKQKNAGIVKTRNKGVSLAKGSYLMQLDADDWLDDTYIEKAVGVAEIDEVDIVYSDLAVFGRENKFINFPEHNIEILKYQNYIHASALVKGDVFSSIKYDEALEKLGYEDWDLFLGACLSGKKAKKMTGPVLHYKKHNEARSRSDINSSYKRALNARIYIFNKYYKKHKEEMKSLESLAQLFIRIQNDYEGLLTREKNLRNFNKKVQDEVRTLEKNISIMQQSKFWKARDKYHQVRRLIGLDGRK